jgi:hypothetical protein
MLPDQLGMLVINRAGMRLLLGDTDLGKVLDQDFGFDLEFPRQLVDPDLIRFLHGLRILLRFSFGRAFLGRRRLCD